MNFLQRTGKAGFFGDLRKKWNTSEQILHATGVAGSHGDLRKKRNKVEQNGTLLRIVGFVPF
jgi:hypothetical protein